MIANRPAIIGKREGATTATHAAQPPEDARWIDLADPAFRADPYPFYERARAAHPVVWDGGVLGRGAWVVTGYSACVQVLRDGRFIKEAERLRPPDAEPPAMPAARQALIENGRHSMLFRDPPDHTRLRGLVSQAFTPRHLERLRPRIVAMVEGLLDALAGRRQVDLIADYAFPIPVTVIAELLGLPPEDRDRYRAWSAPLAASLDPTASDERLDAANQGMQALRDYLQGIIAERRRAPRDDLISSLIAARDRQDRLSEEELVATAGLLLVAGFETTVNLIGNATLALLRQPSVRHRVSGEQPLPDTAVDEFLRYDSPVQMTVRFAAETVTVEGQTIRRGDAVLVVLGAANRDPAVFAEPERLVLDRPNAGRHLAFATGIHVCLGAPLARMEGAIALRALWRRYPNLDLAAPDGLAWRDNVVLRGLARLPVVLR